MLHDLEKPVGAAHRFLPERLWLQPFALAMRGNELRPEGQSRRRLNAVDAWRVQPVVPAFHHARITPDRRDHVRCCQDRSRSNYRTPPDNILSGGYGETIGKQGYFP
ncbi:hypothetical protein [Mesorhizobium argentiipisi]|uniref:Uncharacterized protein n=1 Tax=Mesorhizobium argentiipisi TaxID=3015175 RepID=A0ABU8KKF3_9HYPH